MSLGWPERKPPGFSTAITANFSLAARTVLLDISPIK
jgi:hypothetical protein